MFIVLLFSLLGLSFATQAQSFSFLAYGDMPYFAADSALLQQGGKLQQAASNTEHQFVVHVGDLKAGSEPCTNALLQRNYRLISSLTKQPFIYTPGDNDWTDCDRKKLTPRYDELERLAYVRQSFASKPVALSDFARQAEQPENQRWLEGNTLFLTLHIAGTNNGRRQILLSDKQTALSAATVRDHNNLTWLSQNLNGKFQAAVIFFQADIYQQSKHTSACTANTASQCDGFKHYREQFSRLAEQSDFPILLVHGDTGPYCVNSPSNNLWRLNAPGDYQHLDIAKITVDVTANQPFAIEGLLAKQPPEVCQ